MRCPSCKAENLSDSVFCGKCATPLPPVSGQASFTKTLETPPAELVRGMTVAGRYEIIEELGTGGMGRVYRAHDTKLNEEVALKLIKPEIAADKKVVERFRNELKTTRKIRHKNVCGMYDFHEDGKTLFLTMEYVRGEDLKSLIHRTKTLSVGTALSIARQVAEGLGEAHKLGITHRDLKPGNIMIDKDGQAKVMDFGIARVKQEKGVTGEGAIIGTPEYMSPEQVDGKPADPRSDIYSLGVILFEMIVGSAPFEGETPFAIANKHKTEPPPVPKKLVPQIPEGLNKAILRCLDKDKAKRYQTTEELAADLSAVEQAIPVTDRALIQAKTRTRTSREITVKFTRRKLMIPAGVVIVMAIATVMMLTLFKPPPGKIDSIAVLPLADLSKDESGSSFVEGMHDALINELTKIQALNVIGRRNVLRYKDTNKSIPEIARELGVAALLEGSVVRAGDRVRITLELVDGRTDSRVWGPRQFDRANADILSLYSEVALTIAREINANLTAREIEDLSRSRAVKPAAYDQYLRARTLMWSLPNPDIGTDAVLKQALELCAGSVRIDPNFALGYAMLARVHMAMHELGSVPVSEAAAKAREAASKAVSLDDSAVEAHEVLGRVKFQYDWDFEGAEKEFRRAMELGLGSFRGYVIEYLCLRGDFDEAIALQKRIIELDPLYPDYANLGWIYFMARRYGEALAALDRALELNLDVPYVRNLRTNCLAFNHSCPQAIAETEKILAETPPASAETQTLINMAINYAVCGERQQARDLIEIVKKRKDYKAVDLAWVYPWLGEIDLALGALEKAFEERSPLLLSLNVDPYLDSLRTEPRFIALLKKIGF